MRYLSFRTGGLKLLVGWAVVFIIRLIPFRPPNFEPLMAALMPFSKRFGPLTGFLFAFLAIALFDLATGKAGQWTLITGTAYGLVGLASHLFFRRRRASALNFLLFGAFGVILYDALTGLTVGPLMFGQPLAEAFVGQVPFTLYHLAGTAVLSVSLSPALHKWVACNDRLEYPLLVRPAVNGNG
jgi:uncharacterized membrane protein